MKVQMDRALPVPVVVLRICTRLRKIRRSVELLQPYTIYIFFLTLLLHYWRIQVKCFFKEVGNYRLQPENDSMEPIIVGNVNITGKAIGIFGQMR